MRCLQRAEVAAEREEVERRVARAERLERRLEAAGEEVETRRGEVAREEQRLAETALKARAMASEAEVGRGGVMDVHRMCGCDCCHCLAGGVTEAGADLDRCRRPCAVPRRGKLRCRQSESAGGRRASARRGELLVHEQLVAMHCSPPAAPSPVAVGDVSLSPAAVPSELKERRRQLEEAEQRAEARARELERQSKQAEEELNASRKEIEATVRAADEQGRHVCGTRCQWSAGAAHLAHCTNAHPPPGPSRPCALVLAAAPGTGAARGRPAGRARYLRAPRGRPPAHACGDRRAGGRDDGGSQHTQRGGPEGDCLLLECVTRGHLWWRTAITRAAWEWHDLASTTPLPQARQRLAAREEELQEQWRRLERREADLNAERGALSDAQARVAEAADALVDRQGEVVAAHREAERRRRELDEYAAEVEEARAVAEELARSAVREVRGGIMHRGAGGHARFALLKE